MRQTERSAKTVAALLRSYGLDLTVHPVLILAGPGAPSLCGATVLIDGVRIAAFRDSTTWRPAMTGTHTGPRRQRRLAQANLGISDPNLSLPTAATAAGHLLTFCDRREAHQRTASARRTRLG